MSRPQRCRRICQEPKFAEFSPDGIDDTEGIRLSLDEFEVIRLVDLEKQTHEQCAMQMEISRTTVTEIYESAREKIANCIVNGRRLIIAGGNYRVCGGAALQCCGGKCKFQTQKNTFESQPKEAHTIRIAVTYENGQVFQHFGHSEQFKFYDVKKNQITAAQITGTNGSGHRALVGFLVANDADILICGRIGGGAKAALADAGVKLYDGVSGSTEEAVKALLSGTLRYNSDLHCNHRNGEHDGQTSL